MTKRQPKGTPVGGQFAPDRKPDGGDLSSGTTSSRLRVRNRDGVPFEVRIVRKGERYGLNDAILNDEGEKFFDPNDPTLVEFWDAGQNPELFPDGCQFTGARYGLATIRKADLSNGIQLYGDSERWTLDGDSATTVQRWLSTVARDIESDDGQSHPVVGPPPGHHRDEKVPGCPLCAETGVVPPHYASRWCESGGREHCTCDVCF